MYGALYLISKLLREARFSFGAETIDVSSRKPIHKQKGDQRPANRIDSKVLKMVLCGCKHLFWVKYYFCQGPDLKPPRVTTERVSTF